MSLLKFIFTSVLILIPVALVLSSITIAVFNKEDSKSKDFDKSRKSDKFAKNSRESSNKKSSNNHSPNNAMLLEETVPGSPRYFLEQANPSKNHKGIDYDSLANDAIQFQQENYTGL